MSSLNLWFSAGVVLLLNFPIYVFLFKIMDIKLHAGKVMIISIFARNSGFAWKHGVSLKIGYTENKKPTE